MVLCGVVVQLCARQRVDRRGWQGDICPVGAVGLCGLGPCFGLFLLSSLPTWKYSGCNDKTWLENLHALPIQFSRLIKSFSYGPKSNCSYFTINTSDGHEKNSFFLVLGVYLLQFKVLLCCCCHNSTPKAAAWKGGFRASDWTQRFQGSAETGDKWPDVVLSSSPPSIPPMKPGWNMSAFSASSLSAALMEVCGSVFHFPFLHNISQQESEDQQEWEDDENRRLKTELWWCISQQIFISSFELCR